MTNHAPHNHFRFDDIRILLNGIFARLISVQLLKFGKRSSAYTEMFCHRIQRGTGYIYSDKIICIYCTWRFFIIQMSIWNILCNTTNVPVTIALNLSNCQWWKTVQSWIKNIPYRQSRFTTPSLDYFTRARYMVVCNGVCIPDNLYRLSPIAIDMLGQLSCWMISQYRI